MTGELFEHIEAHGAAVDLSARAKFILIGEDRVRYLNGQVTNDVRAATPDAALHACVTNAKGRIEGDVFIHVSQAGGQGLWLDAEEGLREPLAARFERYIISEDVTLKDKTEAWKLWHFLGEARMHAPLPDQVVAGGVVTASRFGEEGLDVWLPASETVWLPPSVKVLTPDEAETLRVIRGIPRWPNELNPEAFPQEAGLERRSMSFTKGCYIGQEVLSRIKTTGKMPRRLVRFTASAVQEADALAAALAEAAPLALFSGGADEPKAAGTVTSIVRHPGLDRPAGLGYVRHGLEAGDSLLLGSESPLRIFAKVDISPT